MFSTKPENEAKQKYVHNNSDELGNTALHQICLDTKSTLTETQAVNLITSLISKDIGINFNQKNKEMKTALMIAVEKDAIFLLNMLLLLQRVNLGESHEEIIQTLKFINKINPRIGDNKATIEYNLALKTCKTLAEEKILPRSHPSFLMLSNGH